VTLAGWDLSPYTSNPAGYRQQDGLIRDGLLRLGISLATFRHADREQVLGRTEGKTRWTTSLPARPLYSGILVPGARRSYYRIGTNCRSDRP